MLKIDSPMLANPHTPLDVVDFVEPKHSKARVRLAGDVLKQAHDQVSDELTDAFSVAYAWRDAHALPMSAMLSELRGLVRRGGGVGYCAARLKRMASIRPKLARFKLRLADMQDLAGARAILPSISDVERVSALLESARFGPSKPAVDYMAAPKADGYRSVHRVLKMEGHGERAPWGGMKVEVQVRTRLQHAWATAVEAHDMMSGETSLKGGQGDDSWRRFFALMSGEIAEVESAPLPASVPENRSERREELAHLNREIDALRVLESYRLAADAADARPDARYFLLMLDTRRKTVKIRSFYGILDGGDAYNQREASATSTVLVESGDAKNLAAAYPNYFLDIRAFVGQVRVSLGGHDLSWLSEYGRC